MVNRAENSIIDYRYYPEGYAPKIIMILFTGFWFDGKKNNKVPVWDSSKRKKVEISKSHYTIVVSIIIITTLILNTTFFSYCSLG